MGVFKAILSVIFGGALKYILTVALIATGAAAWWSYSMYRDASEELNQYKSQVKELEAEVRREELRVKQIADSIVKREELERDLRREIDHRKEQLEQLKRTDADAKAWAEDAYRGTAIQY